MRQGSGLLLSVVCVGLVGCGEPDMLNMQSSVVNDGTTGVYQFTLQNQSSRKFARDGTFSVSYVNGAGEVRCRGEAPVQKKDQRHDGEFYVVIQFAKPCTRVKSTTETKGTYTFQPTKGAALTYADPTTGVDLSTWDQDFLTTKTYAKEATALRPTVIAEMKRFAPLAAALPHSAGEKLVPCPPAVSAALQKAAPARLSYDDLLRLASRAPEPGHDDLGFTSEGVHTVMASSVADPLYAAGDPRMTHFTPPAYVEVFRTTAFKRWRIITQGDKNGTFEPGSVWGELTILDVAKHHVVCGGPLSVTNDQTIEGGYNGDAMVLKNLADNFRTRRTIVERELTGGTIPNTP